MALKDISFVKGQGGLGRPLPGQDFFSGMIFYALMPPSGFTLANNILKFYSITDAENNGITTDFSDELPSSASVTVTSPGTNGDTISIVIAEPLGKTVTLGTYTKVAADATTDNVSAGIVAAINANTQTTGYKAVAVEGSVVLITARPGLGIALDTGAPLSATIIGTLAITIVQFAGGAASLLAVYHYHIAEFFRLQPKGILYVGFFPIPAAYVFTEIRTLQIFSGGIIRQVGIYKDGAPYATADLTAIQAVKLALDGKKMPLSVIYAADISQVVDLSAIGDLSQLVASGVSSCITQDGAAAGAALFYAYGKSITTLGALLGAVALAKVSESIAWVQKFNISNGTECDVIAFANGTLYTDASISDELLSTLNDQRHIFLRKFVGTAGSYFNDSHTAIATNSDYAYIEDNRTIDKADRLVYTYVLPYLNGPVELNADGTISDNSIAYITGLAEAGLDQMVRNSELSGRSVTIDPTQNLNVQGKLIIAAQLLQEDVARDIQVNIGYTSSLS